MGPDLLDDLGAEYDELDALLASVDEGSWDSPTPAVPFLVRDQVLHLALGEELAALAIAEPAAFQSRLVELLADVARLEQDAAVEARQLRPDDLLGRWRHHRNRTLDGLRAAPPDARVGWITGEMSVASFATARLMETWAHGQDVVDGLGWRRPPTARLRHVADLGVRTCSFSYRNRGLAVPEGAVWVELDGPSGEQWVWGPADAPDRVCGPVEDFCLVVTQRRHLADTSLDITGPGAGEWLAIAQAFAGPPTDGRRPGQFPTLDP
ncbi:MAG TPA: TIGR03084 family metal-binding protein [Acidimicrobiales bacterium]